MSILSILEPANATTVRAHHRPAHQRQHPATVGSDLLSRGRWPRDGHANFDHGAERPCLDRYARAARPLCVTRRCIAATDTRPGSPPVYERARAECTSSSAPGGRPGHLHRGRHRRPHPASCGSGRRDRVVFESEHHRRCSPAGRRTVRLAAPSLANQAVSARRRRARNASEGRGWSSSNGASNVTGEIFPIAEMRSGQAARRTGLPRRGPARAAPVVNIESWTSTGLPCRPQALRPVRRAH